LQADAFSCPDSGDFNNVPAQKPSIHALFEISVNAQALFFSAFAIHSPVANIANPAYCWGALKEKRTAPLSKSQSSTPANRDPRNTYQDQLQTPIGRTPYHRISYRQQHHLSY
jgi:hypothetical protein